MGLDWLTIHTFGCHYCNNNRCLSVRGLNDENVKRITQYLHGKSFCMSKKSEKPQVRQRILYLYPLVLLILENGEQWIISHSDKMCSLWRSICLSFISQGRRWTPYKCWILTGYEYNTKTFSKVKER